MPTPFRVIDTGTRDGCANIAFDAAMIELRAAGSIPDTIRFLQFPPTALIGRHQSLRHEVNVDYCKENNVGIARRLTGGGAIYFDSEQLGWSLVFDRSTLGTTSLTDLAQSICEAAAAGLRSLGVNARYRPRNDIEVDGRKISGTGGFFDGNTLFYQGTVLVDTNPDEMFAALRVPAAKLAKRELGSASARIVSLKELLGEELPTISTIKASLLAGFSNELGISIQPDEISTTEEQTAAKILKDEVGTEEFINEVEAPIATTDVAVGTCTGRGGTINCYARFEGAQQKRLREVLFTGDFFVTPPRVVFDLEAALRGATIDDYDDILKRFFDNAIIDMLSVTPADFAHAINDAVANKSRSPSA
ncbi:MAG: lipoate--protein ligase family protein [Gammaproteobacteria bacterium]